MKRNEIEVGEGEVFQLLAGYVDEHNVCHKEFEITEITGVEEEAISKPEIKQNGGKFVRTLIELCCIRIGTLTRKELGVFKWRELINKLSVADQDMILIKIRENSLGDELETQHTCPHCKNSMTTFVKTEELEITPFNGLREVEFELPKGYKDKDGNIHKKGKLRMPNGLDREILDPIARKNMGQANTLLLTRCIIELEGTPIYDDLVKSLSLKDRKYLFALMDENKYGVVLTTDVVCPNCGEEFKASLNVVNFI